LPSYLVRDKDDDFSIAWRDRARRIHHTRSACFSAATVCSAAAVCAAVSAFTSASPCRISRADSSALTAARAGSVAGGQRTSNLVTVSAAYDAAAGTVTLGAAPGTGGNGGGGDDDDDD